MSVRRGVAGLAATVALVVSCSGDDGAPDARGTDGSETTSSTVSSSTTDAEPTNTTAPAPTGTPVAAGDPASLADQIEEAEAAIAAASIANPAAAADLLAYPGHLQQVAYRQLAAHPEWDAAVRKAVAPELRPLIDANVSAGRELRALVRRPRATLPAWRIVDPPAADELLGHYKAAEIATGVPVAYLAAVHLVETRMGRIRGTSTAGAQGPMQFLPSTWAAYGEGDINDTGDAIRAAARYLQANGAPQDMANALYRYNPTPRYVNAVTAYARRMQADLRAFLGYYQWQVYYATTLGDVLLPVGYEATEERPVTAADVDPAGS